MYILWNTKLFFTPKPTQLIITSQELVHLPYVAILVKSTRRFLTINETSLNTYVFSPRESLMQPRGDAQLRVNTAR